MDPYFSSHQLWPDGPYLQACVLPDLQRDTDLAQLVARTHDVLAAFPCVAPVPPTWLHVTLQACLHRPAAAIPATDRTALTSALTAAVGTLPAFTITAGSVLAGQSGVVLDMHPDHRIDPLYDQVRTVIRDVLGEHAVTKDSRPAHMALGYGRDVWDSGRIQTQLRRRARPSHAPLTVDAIHLVEVTPDPIEHLFRWTHIARLPLHPGSPAAAAHPRAATTSTPIPGHATLPG